MTTTLVLVAIAIAVIYPRLNVHSPGHGSDRDDALDYAVNALVHGRFPYSARTYLNNQITPLPGTILLSLPSLLVGGVAYMNIAWLALFAATLRLRDGGWRSPLFALWGLLASPGVLIDLATGGDLVANGIYLLGALYLYLRALDGGRVNERAYLAAAILLGLTLSSRFNFALVLLPVTAFAGRRRGWRIAIQGAATASLTFAVVTVPFILHAPDAFPPLHVYHQYDQVIPHAGVVMTFIEAVVGVGLSLSILPDDVVGTIAAAALTCAAPLLMSAAYAWAVGYRTMAVVIAGRAACATPLAMAVLAAWRLAPARENARAS